jgi:hypothetical protein
MRTNKFALAGLGIVMAFGISAGAGLANATPSSAPSTAHPVSAACSAAQQQVLFAQSRVDEAAPTRSYYSNLVTSQKASRQAAINAGNVEQVGRINVQLGSSTALFNTTDSAYTAAQAQVVNTKAAKNAAC